jgi:gliding motility-associated-like protein
MNNSDNFTKYSFPMKAIFRTVLLLLLATQTDAQYAWITNLSGTSSYGSLNVTVTSAGSISSGGGTCLPGSGGTYWIGFPATPPAGGSYTYTFSKPVWAIKIACQGINGAPLGTGEYVKAFVNGSFYPIQPADVTSYTETCPGGGPCYLWTGLFMGPVGLPFPANSYNGGDFTINSCTGINSFELYCDGSLYGTAYNIYADTVKPPSCVYATSNSPCINDTLQLKMVGDSIGATYAWKGPGGFTSTLQNPFFYPCVFADTGWYYVIRNAGIVNDTDSTHVVIHPKPVVITTNNSPLCAGLFDTLKLSVLPFTTGETFSWSGPGSYSSTLEFPARTGVTTGLTGLYTVIATTAFGCTDTGTTAATVIPQPAIPVITGLTFYCQGTPFVPFTVSGYSGTLEWYTTGAGGVASTTPITINTSIPGYYTVWVSQRTAGCESNRASISVRVTTTPGAPAVSGKTEYCQFEWPFLPLSVTIPGSGKAKALWYKKATGGTGSFVEPTPGIDTAGTYNYWVSLTDSGCEGPRTPVTIVVHPKPAPPKVTNGTTCQFWPTLALIATPSTPGDLLRWSLTMPDTVGSVTAPVPPSVTPGAQYYYVNETSPFGCVSDKAIDTFTIKPKPQAPATRDTTYCQFTKAPALTADSSDGSHLKWYILGNPLPKAPVPSNNMPGDSTWYVVQIINGCPSDSTALKVTTVYKPVFSIAAQRPWVCQYDTLRLSYSGPTLTDAAYVWSIPTGAGYAFNGNSDFNRKSIPTDSMVYVRFDSTTENNYVRLFASDNHGFCFSDTSIRIKIVPHPSATSSSKADVCAGDTVSLALSYRSANASIFTWTVDKVPMDKTTAMNILAHNSNSGGPFSISWNDSGRHTIQVTATTDEGCTTQPTDDSIYVHLKPDASFTYTTKNGPLCLEDSIQFIARATDYNYSFAWSPEHFFQNINKGVTWGKVEQSRSIITLLVTDPFGCAATTSQEIDPNSCCTVGFPTAFTPNGDHKNDVFRPIYAGYHRFHIFRVANRWGQTVYESTNSNMQWDGNYNGVPQDMGVYFYYLQYDCGGNTMEKSGDVTLIR